MTHGLRTVCSVKVPDHAPNVRNPTEAELWRTWGSVDPKPATCSRSITSSIATRAMRVSWRSGRRNRRLVGRDVLPSIAPDSSGRNDVPLAFVEPERLARAETRLRRSARRGTAPRRGPCGRLPACSGSPCPRPGPPPLRRARRPRTLPPGEDLGARGPPLHLQLAKSSSGPSSWLTCVNRSASSKRRCSRTAPGRARPRSWRGTPSRPSPRDRRTRSAVRARPLEGHPRASLRTRRTGCRRRPGS